MSCNFSKEYLIKIFNDAENKLLNNVKIKFEFDRKWSSKFPANAGVYAIYEVDNLLYVGQTDNLKERMKEVKRTYNHSFRKKLGRLRFNGVIEKNRKYSEKIESQMNVFFREKLFFSYINVNFGRLEIEGNLIEKYQHKLFNSKNKRKS